MNALGCWVGNELDLMNSANFRCAPGKTLKEEIDAKGVPWETSPFESAFELS